MNFFGIVGLFLLSFVLGLASAGVQRFHTHWVPRLGGISVSGEFR